MSQTTQQRLDAYIDAEARILKGQSVQFDGDQLTLADLDTVRKAITRLQSQVSAEKRKAAGGSRLNVTLADFSGC
ncbi:hypothetical protein [Spectribacter hydrogenoxidans]|uniref:GpW protein n=1 Tax=Spectribacter hydrogenoxidans TaxID=3075608 RepID=A0ABU3C0P0_9GAMM|nr:hypothetical protein [Salinisphaera sp. W335]MDT0635093.1 hypothetical protein [Salinisphaera sp. W335]